MALAEVNTPAFDFARGLAVSTQNTIPPDALAQLSRLRDEASRDLDTARFLARAPQACIILLTAGVVMALSSANGLMAEFTWAVMLLAGILAIISHHIRSVAAAQRQQSWQAAADRLRGLLLYMGLAWGSGAFLVLPGQPVFTFVFAIVPAALLALILKDRQAIAAFAVPAAVATVMAATLGGWPQTLWVGAAIFVSLPGIIVLPALQQQPRGGLALR